jgi:sulfur relay (sulfurtransferase) DsrC/TusE family protein
MNLRKLTENADKLNITLSNDKLFILKMVHEYYSNNKKYPTRRIILTQAKENGFNIGSISLHNMFGEQTFTTIAKLLELPDPDQCL